MHLALNVIRPKRAGRNTNWFVLGLFLLVAAIPFTTNAALPTRLVLLLDGISYRHMKALQEGVTYKDSKGRQIHRQAFHQNYFPVSRLVSTFPSVSDPAWTEILGNRPPPGYQRTYFNASEGIEVYINGVTSSAEFERQMTWQVDGGFRRLLSYVFPLNAFEYEMNAVVDDFLKTTNRVTNFYAMLHSTDIAQHLSGDIYSLLCELDTKLEGLRTIYREREGKELEILILSDHGNNQAGNGNRVDIRGFLKRAGYRTGKSIQHPNDIVLPTAGIESWIEIHNSPERTEDLMRLLVNLEGVDVLTARSPNRPNQFIVMNSRAERALIDWDVAKNSFRYSSVNGDPINYLPVVESLVKKNTLDARGFATAEAWLAETLSHRYPLALERIARGHTKIVRNPASILISLKNDYVHCEWLIRRGIALVKSGGTHGGLDELNSNGILLSSFMATHDTSTSRVERQIGGFKGLRDFRAEENGAEWVALKLETEKPFLRVWSPSFAQMATDGAVQVKIAKANRASSVRIRRTDPIVRRPEHRLTLNRPVPVAENNPWERIYGIPSDLVLKPLTVYRISGQIQPLKTRIQLFQFTFRTDKNGLPLAQ